MRNRKTDELDGKTSYTILLQPEQVNTLYRNFYSWFIYRQFRYVSDCTASIRGQWDTKPIEAILALPRY